MLACLALLLTAVQPLPRPTVPLLPVPQLAPLATGEPKVLYAGDFATGNAGFSVQWTGAGKLTMQRDTAQPAPSGKPSVRCDAAAGTKATLGVGLPVGADRLWQIRLQARATSRGGTAQVALQVWNGGKQIDWIGIGSLKGDEQWHALAGVVPLPAAATNLNLLVVHEGELTTWIGDVSVRTVAVTPEQAAQLRPPTAVQWATTSFLNTKERGTTDTLAKLLVVAGVTHTRGWVDWRKAEPEPGKYDFTELDDYLATLDRYGAKAGMVCIHGTPPWAHGKTVEKDMPADRKDKPWFTSRSFWAPRDWSTWERFVTALATRYRGRVGAWEILNEPDLWSEGFNGSLDEYEQYMRRGYRSAKAADPACRVYSAAFVFDEWLPGLLRDGYADSFDGICIHPYHTEPTGSVSRARRAQLDLLSAGLAKEVLVTEVGFQSGGWKEGPGVKSDEATKASCGRATLAGLAQVSGFIAWYTAAENGNMYGLVRDDGDRLTPQPMLYEYGRLTGRLPDERPAVHADVRVDGDRLILTATNTGATAAKARFWPIGFVPALGMTAADWDGTLAPGATHEVVVALKLPAKAGTAYPVGLAVIGEQANDLALVALSKP